MPPAADAPFALVVLVGFLAQLVDGALGMAYGVSSTTFLLALGLPPAAASASVHSAEVFTTAASGLAHLKFGNVDRKLALRLLVPGIVGAVLGAYVLVNVSAPWLKPAVAAYLLVMGGVILRKALGKPPERERRHPLVPLGLAGGFLDSVGGGGWGPIVTSTLVSRGSVPHLTIGSVNVAEFFVTIAQAGTFAALLGVAHGRIVLGLVLGGVVAAPLAAWAARRVPARPLMIAVGTLIVILSARTLWLALR